MGRVGRDGGPLRGDGQLTAVEPTTRPLSSLVRPLTEFASQATFRALLHSLARPGTPYQLPPGNVPAVMLPALALADVETSIAVSGPHGPGWQDALCAATGSSQAAWGEADLAIALRPPSPEALRALRRGEPAAPETSARLSIACTALGSLGELPRGSAGRSAGCSLTLRGPGIAGCVTLWVEGLDPDVFEAITAVNHHFPLGIDVHLVDERGLVVSLARTTQITIAEHKGAC